MEHARSSYRILGEDDVGSEASGIRPMQVSDDGAGPRTTATFIRLFGKGPADWPPEDALPALSDAMSAERIDEIVDSIARDRQPRAGWVDLSGAVHRP